MHKNNLVSFSFWFPANALCVNLHKKNRLLSALLYSYRRYLFFYKIHFWFFVRFTNPDLRFFTNLPDWIVHYVHCERC